MERDPIPADTGWRGRNVAPPAYHAPSGAAEPSGPRPCRGGCSPWRSTSRTRAAAAWRELQPDLDFERMEAGTFELMPLISRRPLQAAGQNDPLSARLNGIYRKSWFIHSLVLERRPPPRMTSPPAGSRRSSCTGRASGVRYYAEAAMRYSPYAGLVVATTRSTAQSRASPASASTSGRIAAPRGGTTPALRRARQQHRPPQPIGGRLRRRRASPRTTSPPERRDVRRGGGSLRVPDTDGRSPRDRRRRSTEGRRIADLVWLLDAVMIGRSGNVDWEALVERAVCHPPDRSASGRPRLPRGPPGTGVPTEVRSRLADAARDAARAAGIPMGVRVELGARPAPHDREPTISRSTRDRSPWARSPACPGTCGIAGAPRTSGSSPSAVARRTAREAHRAPPGVATKPVNRVSLTFDDGPGPLHGADPRRARRARWASDVLRHRQLREEARDLVRRMAAEGHEVGNHSWSHPRLADSGRRRLITRELRRTNKLLTKVLGAPPRRFRGPGVQRRRAGPDDRLELSLGTRAAT